MLEPVIAYLLVAQEQYKDSSYAGSYNIGPDEADFLTTGELAEQFCDIWNCKAKDYGLSPASWIERGDDGPHEAAILKLDCSKIKNTFGWKPRWHGPAAVEKIVEWEMNRNAEGNIQNITQKQIENYLCGTD